MRMTTSERVGLTLIIALISITATGIFFVDPIAQPPEYHAFADNNAFLNIPNFRDVFSNIGFLIVGFLGFFQVIQGKKLKIANDLKPAYALLFLGIASIAFGSGYYHLWPENRTLVWDRLAMSIAFMALMSIIVGEFISVRTGKVLLAPLILAGIGSVLYWYATEVGGAGDLRPYVLVQFLPMLLIPIILVCFRSTFTRPSAYWWLLLAYAVAKVFEHFDAEIFHMLGVLSGHALKHLTAAAGLYFLLVSYRKRDARS